MLRRLDDQPAQGLNNLRGLAVAQQAALALGDWAMKGGIGVVLRLAFLLALAFAISCSGDEDGNPAQSGTDDDAVAPDDDNDDGSPGDDDDDDNDDDNDSIEPDELTIELVDGGAFDTSAIGAAVAADGTRYVAAVHGRTLCLYTQSGKGLVREFLAFPVAHAEMAMDADEALHFTYVDSTTGDVDYLTNRGGDWTAETVTTVDLDNDAAPELTLALGPDGSPHLAVAQETLVYAARTADGWTTESVPAAGSVSEAALVVDEAGVPHLAYAGVWTIYAYVDYATRGDRGWESARVIQQLADEPSGELFYINYYAGLDLQVALSGEPRLTFGDNRILCEFLFYECSATVLHAAFTEGAGWTIDEIQAANALVENTATGIDALARLHGAYTTAWRSSTTTWGMRSKPPTVGP
jgi:hypothetical protein